MRRAAVVLLAGALALSGCAAGHRAPADATPVPTPTASAPADRADPATDPRYARFYTQEVDWRRCGDGAQCGKVTVPVDWDAPDGDTLQLALARRPATRESRGALLVNFGGPGVAGASLVRRHDRAGTSSKTVRRAYDLVGFDPRGTGGSAPLDCLGDRELDAFLAFDPVADPTTDLPAAAREFQANARPFIDGCARDGGPLLAHLDAGSVARDMDVIRAALGQDRLNYLGYSYGTLLGALYADAHPQRVGRMVLDGAMDPASTFTDVEVGQAQGMERALRAFVTWCLDEGDCALTGDVDEGMRQIGRILATADRDPLRTGDGRRLTAALALTGIISPLYDDQAWPDLDDALGRARDGDGSGLLELADEYSERDDEGRYASNLNEIFNAVKCVDYPATADTGHLQDTAARIRRAAPVLGPYLSHGELLCAQWPVPPARTPAPVTAAGAPGILVVGTTGDPATPYAWARSLAGQLESGVLLTHEGEGHIAYQRSSACVDRAVDAYLVDGLLVPDGTVCQ